jgi:hypothetical protein
MTARCHLSSLRGSEQQAGVLLGHMCAPLYDECAISELPVDPTFPPFLPNHDRLLRIEADSQISSIRTAPGLPQPHSLPWPSPFPCHCSRDASSASRPPARYPHRRPRSQRHEGLLHDLRSCRSFHPGRPHRSCWPSQSPRRNSGRRREVVARTAEDWLGRRKGEALCR